MRPDVPFLFLSVQNAGVPASLTVSAEADEIIPEGLTLRHHRIFPEVLAHKGASRDVVLLGSPFEGETIEREALAAKLAGMDDPVSYIHDLNGEFGLIIHDRAKGVLDIYTDRFASFPFYYATKASAFFASTNYLDLARVIRDWPGFALRPEKAYEFLMMQRLFGNETHDTLSSFIPAGSRLRLNIAQLDKVEISRYWRPFQKPKRKDSITAQINEFVPLLAKAVKRRVPAGTGADTGLFLSGGHDGRLIAGYAPEKITCYTYGMTDNNEVECARRVARHCGHNHEYINVPDDFFTRTLDRSAWLNAGMYAIDHALFIPVEGRHNPHSKVYMNGHGLDYFFHGTYLNTRWRELLGRPTFYRAMIGFPKDVVDYFLKTISFRLKYDLTGLLVKADARERMKKALHDSVSGVMNEGKTFSGDMTDQWDYLVFHNQSRHFTYGNILSMRVDGEVRTPCYDRELYDLNFTLQPEHRIHGLLPLAAMRRHSWKLAALPAGNFGMPAGALPWMRTAWLIGRKVLRDLTGSKKFHGPQPEDRTWPDRQEYMETHPEFWGAATEALRDQRFMDMMDFLDWGKIKAEAETIRSQPGGSAFWVYMLSYYRFYKFLYA